MATAGTSAQVVEDVIFDAIAQLGPPRNSIKRESTFEDLDVDSLDLVEIAQVVDERWRIELEPQDLTNVKTVGEALDLVVARIS